MQMPETIEVGPYSYQLTEDPVIYNEVSVAKNDAAWGWCQYGKLRIVVSPAQEVMHKRVTVLHEMLHAINDLSDQRIEDEEKILRAIGAPLLDVLRRNPALVAYLTEED